MIEVNDNNFNPDPFADVNDPYHFARDEYRELQRERVRTVSRLKSDYLALYYELWGLMSLESKSKVLEAENFNEEDVNVYQLWQAIILTHRCGGYDQIQNQHHARQNYSRIHQYPKESLAAFKERFMEAIHQLESVSEHIPSDENQAIDFIYKLDHITFAKFKTELDNMVNSGVGSYPATVNEAYRRASRHKEVIYNNKDNGNRTTRLHIINPGDRAAFHINNNNNNSSLNNNNDNNDNGNGSDIDEKKSSSNNKNKKVSTNSYKNNNYPCLMCGENGHKTHQCPELEERQRFLKSYNKKKNNTNKEDDDATIQRRINLATAIINPAFQDKNTSLFKNSEVLLDTLYIKR